jgi:ATP-dependent Lhr-like helicase
MFEMLAVAGRATRVTTPPVWVAAERLPELLAVHPGAGLTPVVTPPPSRAARSWTREAAIVELLRGRLTITGPATAAAFAASFGVTEEEIDTALLTLESEGIVLRGVFTPGTRVVEWSDRRLLARIHRYTLNRLRAEIAPVTPADFMRFQFVWQHVDPAATLTGADGLRAVVTQLDGLELPARAWEREVLPARLERYDPSLLDMLCLTGAVGWARLSTGPTQVVGATPVALFLREHADIWLDVAAPKPVATDNGPGSAKLGTIEGGSAAGEGVDRSDAAVKVFEHLTTRGASFGADLADVSGLSADEFRAAIAELVAAGLVTSDGFAGLRALIGSSPRHAPARLHRADGAGRWAALPLRGDSPASRTNGNRADRDAAVETVAWALLRRYGVVFRRLLAREGSNVAWRELARVYRRLEARGEIRGGRFVSGMSGEQFATTEAVERLREIRRSGDDDRLITISAADPLNLTGVITPGDRIRAVAGNRIVYRNGLPVAAMEGDMLRLLSAVEADAAADVAAAAAGRRVPVFSGYVGRV